MNKFNKILIFAVFVIVSGMIYQKYYRPPEITPVAASGQVTEIKMRVVENTWAWDPARIKVKAGDLVKIKIFNEDTYNHGFAVEAFGVNRRLFSRRETLVEFLASKTGSFNFYCSVSCGEGHYSQTGLLLVEE